MIECPISLAQHMIDFKSGLHYKASPNSEMISNFDLEMRLYMWHVRQFIGN